MNSSANVFDVKFLWRAIPTWQIWKCMEGSFFSQVCLCQKISVRNTEATKRHFLRRTHQQFTFRKRKNKNKFHIRASVLFIQSVDRMYVSMWGMNNFKNWQTLLSLKAWKYYHIFHLTKNSVHLSHDKSSVESEKIESHSDYKQNRRTFVWLSQTEVVKWAI